ncbi:MAG: hypothetical protein V1735_00255 [Nanoarchaeota archaeon]
MDSTVSVYLDRAENEIKAAEALKRISDDEAIKDDFGFPPEDTFYSGVISHCYYSIFYAAKAILLSKRIQTEYPDVHRKTFDAFKATFVDSGILDVKLLEIYQKLVVRADELLEIFKDEKWKRGHFTYQTIRQANKVPAEESLKNAKTFVLNITTVIGKKKVV